MFPFFPEVSRPAVGFTQLLIHGHVTPLSPIPQRSAGLEKGRVLPFVFYKCDISLHKIKCKTKKV